jgi:ubiquinone/menaquinone biosynthesis C-methylase UbiE
VRTALISTAFRVVVVEYSGAGTGNYAAALVHLGYRVIAIEPATTMTQQARRLPGIRWVASIAERLPLIDSCAGGAVCILALHHFADPNGAMSEMRRVVGRGPIVLFTFDPRRAQQFWFEDYFPQLWNQAHRSFPPLADIVELVREATGSSVEVFKFPLPHDLRDTFAAAGWRRPWMCC